MRTTATFDSTLMFRTEENNLALVSRPIGIDYSKGSFPDVSTLRDPPLGESLEGEPEPQSPDFEYDEKPVKEQEEATPTSPNNVQQRWNNSSVALKLLLCSY